MPRLAPAVENRSDTAAASRGAGLLTLVRVGLQRHAQERSCTWSRAQLERHQQKRLAALRRWVAARSRFYQQFHRGYERRPLHELPILTTSALMENFDALVTDPRIHLAGVERYLSEP